MYNIIFDSVIQSIVERFEKHTHLSYAYFNYLEPNKFCSDKPIPEDPYKRKSSNLKTVLFMLDLSHGYFCQKYNDFISKWPSSYQVMIFIFLKYFRFRIILYLP